MFYLYSEYEIDISIQIQYRKKLKHMQLDSLYKFEVSNVLINHR